MKLKGKVKDIEHWDEEGQPLVGFWLVQTNGNRVRVEVPGGQQVTDGEELEVEGDQDSDGVLNKKVQITRAAKPVLPSPPVIPTPPHPPQPPPQIPWKLVAGIGAGVLALIVIFVATRGGGTDTTVPDLTGMSESQALTRAEKAAMKIGSSKLEAVDDANVGKVIAQTPPPGTPLAADPAQRLVNIVVGGVATPRLIDSTVDAAGLSLQRSGLIVGNISTQFLPGATSLISQQDPGFGTPVRRGASVNFTIRYPLLVGVPRVNFLEQLKVAPNFKLLTPTMQNNITRQLTVQLPK